jgi:hypothetical protein
MWLYRHNMVKHGIYQFIYSQLFLIMIKFMYLLINDISFIEILN